MSNSLKFDSMTEDQRGRWLAWANRHDWGAGEARFKTNLQTGEIGVYVECAAIDSDGRDFTDTFLAMTPRELRDWAGY